MALRLDTEQQWETFLKEADIPDDEAKAYAKIMKNNRNYFADMPDDISPITQQNFNLV